MEICISTKGSESVTGRFVLYTALKSYYYDANRIRKNQISLRRNINFYFIAQSFRPKTMWCVSVFHRITSCAGGNITQSRTKTSIYKRSLSLLIQNFRNVKVVLKHKTLLDNVFDCITDWSVLWALECFRIRWKFFLAQKMVFKSHVCK